MRNYYRTTVVILFAAVWPSFGCHQTPGDKSVQDVRPIQQITAESKRQDLTIADIAQSWSAKADDLEKAGKTGDAIAICEKVRESGSPDALHATKKLAGLYHRSEDFGRAEEQYKKLLEQNPKDADVLAKLGDLYYGRKKWEAAEKFYSDAIHHRADHPYAWSGLGMTLGQQGDYARSLEAFAKVLSKAEAYCQVAFIMTLQGKSADAIRAYEAALTIEPAMPRANTELLRLRQTALTPSATNVTLTTPFRPVGQKATVELEQAAAPEIKGASRLMMQRPALPPSPDFDLPIEAARPTAPKKR